MTDELTASKVAAFLLKHPEFFADHPDVLTEMELPHNTGGAISLMERQVSVLRERNLEMRQRLSKLLDTARDNERLFEKTRRLVLALMEARDLDQAVKALYQSLEQDFNIAFYNLLLFGREGQFRTSTAKVVSLQDARPYIGNLLKTNRAICGTLRELEVELLFAENAPHIGSCAAVPLNHSATFGMLAVGNNDPKYYRSSMGTLFLSYIAEVLNRVLPRLMQP